MRPMPTQSGTALEWRRVPETKPAQFELYVGHDLVARLSWLKNDGSLALAESAHGRWTIKRVGFFSTRVMVRIEGTDSEVAEFVPDWKGDGKLTLAGNTELAWRSKSFWSANYSLVDQYGEEVLAIEHEGASTPNSAEIRLGVARLPEPATLSLVAILALYVGVLAMKDSETASMVAVLAAVIS